MSIIINDKKYNIPDLETKCWLDDSSVQYISHKSSRTKWIRAIVCHTHEGILGNLVPGIGPHTNLGNILARYQINTTRNVSWDMTLNPNGSVLVQNDPKKNFSWQATHVNEETLGFEMVQTLVKNSAGKTIRGDLYEEQINKAVLLIDALTALLGIQRQIPWVNGKQPKGTIKRLLNGNGEDVVGVYGHRNLTNSRGPGDPGDYIFNALKDAGYMLFDYDKNEDLIFWKQKQKELGFKDSECDGIPGPQTVQKLKDAGYPHGILVSRPIDSLISL